MNRWQIVLEATIHMVAVALPLVTIVALVVLFVAYSWRD